jgi:hypothetical protein
MTGAAGDTWSAIVAWLSRAAASGLRPPSVDTFGSAVLLVSGRDQTVT